MKINLAALEVELKRRVTEYPYAPWGRKQADDWDRKTNFIYLTSQWSNLQQLVGDMAPELRNYAVNRWFNFWSAMGVESIFCDSPGVVAAKNPKDRLVDFAIRGIRFDHKTTVWPQNYNLGLYEAMLDPVRLVEWLYQNQSQERRHHCENRLFLVLYDNQGEHWKLRAELDLIGLLVRRYVESFSLDELIRLRLEQGQGQGQKQVLADVIWVVS